MRKYCGVTTYVAKTKYLSTVGLSFAGQLAKVNLLNWDAIKEFEQRKESVTLNARIIPGVKKFITWCWKHDLHVNVVSSTRMALVKQRLAADVVLASRCLVVSGIEAGPKDAQLRKLAHARRSALQNVLFIGDSPVNDRLFAARAGVQFIWFNEKMPWTCITKQIF